jgi:hypothetical protein
MPKIKSQASYTAFGICLVFEIWIYLGPGIWNLLHLTYISIF